MEPPSRIALRHRRTGVAGGAGLAYAVLASFTRPFTLAADVVTAVALAVAVVVVVRTIRHHRRSGLVTAKTGADRERRNRWDVAWLALLAAATAWELYCYAHLPRQQHPTFSVLIDTLDSTRLGKTLSFAAWLALGWFLAAR